MVARTTLAMLLATIMVAGCFEPAADKDAAPADRGVDGPLPDKLRPDSPKLDPDGPPPDTLSPDTLSPDTLSPDTTSWCGNGKLDPG